MGPPSTKQRVEYADKVNPMLKSKKKRNGEKKSCKDIFISDKKRGSIIQEYEEARRKYESNHSHKNAMTTYACKYL